MSSGASGGTKEKNHARDGLLRLDYPPQRIELGQRQLGAVLNNNHIGHRCFPRLLGPTYLCVGVLTLITEHYSTATIA